MAVVATAAVISAGFDHLGRDQVVALRIARPSHAQIGREREVFEPVADARVLVCAIAGPAHLHEVIEDDEVGVPHGAQRGMKTIIDAIPAGPWA